MEIQAYLRIMARKWWVILLVTLIFGCAAVYGSRYFPTKYQAVTSLRITTPLSGYAGDIAYDTYYADRLINTYAQIAGSEQINEQLKQILHVKKLPDITIQTLPNSEIMEISVKDASPQMAAKAANALADLIIAKSRESAKLSSGTTDLSILTERQVGLQNEMNQAKASYAALVKVSAQTSAQITVLENNIRMKEAAYQNLQNEFQQAQLDEAIAANAPTRVPAKTAKDLLSGEMARLDAELAGLRDQDKNLTQLSAEYERQLSSAEQDIQNKETQNANLISQIDAARIAENKRGSAQNVLVVSPATTPIDPAGPSQGMIIGLGAICGLIAGIILAFIIDKFDTRLHSVEQLQQVTDLPLLGSIPRFHPSGRGSFIPGKDTAAQRAFSALCMKILNLYQTRGIKTILITSANPKEGKSTLVTGTALCLASARKNVLIVDAELRKTHKHPLLDGAAVSNGPGLWNLVCGEKTLDDVIQETEHPYLHFLPSGPIPSENLDWLQVSKITAILGKIPAYDFVLIDAPTVFAVPDAYSLALNADGIILVIQPQRTTEEDIRAAFSQLDDLCAKLLGIVVNRVNGKRTAGFPNGKSTIQGKQKGARTPREHFVVSSGIDQGKIHTRVEGDR